MFVLITPKLIYKKHQQSLNIRQGSLSNNRAFFVNKSWSSEHIFPNKDMDAFPHDHLSISIDWKNLLPKSDPLCTCIGAHSAVQRLRCPPIPCTPRVLLDVDPGLNRRQEARSTKFWIKYHHHTPKKNII